MVNDILVISQRKNIVFVQLDCIKTNEYVGWKHLTDSYLYGEFSD